MCTSIHQANIDTRISDVVEAMQVVRVLAENFISIFEKYYRVNCSILHLALLEIQKADCPLSCYRAAGTSLSAVEFLWPPHVTWLNGQQLRERLERYIQEEDDRNAKVQRSRIHVG